MRTRLLLLAVLLAAGGAHLFSAESEFKVLHGSCSIAPATQPDTVRFELNGDCEDDRGHCGHNNTDMPLNVFTGLSIADFRQDGSHVDAAIQAEAGKMTCAGTVHDLTISGEFTFAPDPAFVERMRSLGFTGFSSEKLEAYTLFRIETSWIQSLQSTGITGMNSDTILALRIFKVDASFVRSMSALGYPGLSADKVVAFKIHGVNPDEVRQYRAMGYEPDADQLIQMRIFKVTPDFIQRMKDRGFNQLTISKLVQIRIFNLAD
jgi:hypothetical protein